MTGTPDHDARRPPGAAPSPRRVDRVGLIVAVGLAALSAVLFWDAARIPSTGGYAGIGPADTPRLIGLGLALLAAWAAWDAFKAPAEPAPAQDLPPILWIVGGLGLQLLLFRSAGFSIAGGILFACTAAAFGRRKLWITLPIGIVFALAVFAVFAMLLELSLPAGPLERLVFGV
ncbi:tripartite tricarboxylate transporter TctB family protein [Rubellimicrobium roseum]|uniref:Tripartite tricarboxylate transporter TctB family protein n=1 Tax=Rubellimicrobium roseum TaxID=687525 RepID=A0A5C4NBL6_9RHOB|nr:tripartite tricarboxylate transporter TctB family protein [Rubellimicrobium roseum]TNC72174.1 tripartite tricarboxylate transporter TctB family protein [Rubellimicrobium roseum]